MAEFWIAMYQDINGETGEPDWYASIHPTKRDARQSNIDYLAGNPDAGREDEGLLPPKVVRLTTSLFADASTLLAYDRLTVAEFYCPKIPWLAAVPDGGTWDMDAHSSRMREQGYDIIPGGNG